MTRQCATTTVSDTMYGTIVQTKKRLLQRLFVVVVVFCYCSYLGLVGGLGERALHVEGDLGRRHGFSLKCDLI